MSVLIIVGQMYAGRVACYLLVSHSEYADGTDRRRDGRTTDRYIMLCARHDQHNNSMSVTVQPAIFPAVIPGWMKRERLE